MLEFHRSLERAKAIAAKLVNKWPAKIDGQISSWSNGREQGFFISILSGKILEWRACVFAENRSSDDIVVTFGPYTEFDHTTHQPSEKIWTTSKFFHSEDEAVKAILRWAND